MFEGLPDEQFLGLLTLGADFEDIADIVANQSTVGITDDDGKFVA